jgi:WD40 repeat protein
MAGCAAEFSSAPPEIVHVNAPPLRSLIATLTDEDSGYRGVSQVYFSRDGRTLAAVDVDGGLYLWSTATRKRTGLIAFVPDGTDTRGGIGIPTLSPDTGTLAVGDGNGSSYLWAVPKGD